MKEENPKKNQIWLTVRITNPERQYLDKLLEKSTYCQTLSELIRDMLFKKKITINTYDASLHEVKLKLARIRNELQSIGININQITRYFNSTSNPEEKLGYAEKVAENYCEVGYKIQDLFEVLNNLAKHLNRN